MSEKTRHQTVALVTGASKGIGRGAAEQLATPGKTMPLGARDPQRDNHSGFLTVEQGAAVLVRAATVDPHGPTAGFVGEEGQVPW